MEELNKKNICPDCLDPWDRSWLEIKLIPTNRKNDDFYPKYIPQIKKICYCGKFKSFVKQTPELIDRFNAELEKIGLESYDN